MTGDFTPGARWTIGLWPYDAIVLFDWLMTVDFDQIPVEHKPRNKPSPTCSRSWKPRSPSPASPRPRSARPRTKYPRTWTGSPAEDDGHYPAGRPARWGQTGRPRGNCGYDMTSISRSQAERSPITDQERTAMLALARQTEPVTWSSALADHSARSGPAGCQLRVTAARAGLPPRRRRSPSRLGRLRRRW